MINFLVCIFVISHLVPFKVKVTINISSWIVIFSVTLIICLTNGKGGAKLLLIYILYLLYAR